MVCHRFGEYLVVVTLVLWGLKYKFDIDDVRETTALVNELELMVSGAELTAYDLIVTEK